MVMDAARGAGAYGGTVIHAKGTGMEMDEKFIAFSLPVTDTAGLRLVED